jgi:hypothetical protein
MGKIFRAWIRAPFYSPRPKSCRLGSRLAEASDYSQRRKNNIRPLWIESGDHLTHFFLHLGNNPQSGGVSSATLLS